MLVKLIGAALIMGTSTFLGWQVAGRYVRRVRELRDLQTALAVLQTEVEYGAIPMPQALAEAARAAGAVVGGLLAGTATRLQGGRGCTAGDALRSAVDAIVAETALKPDDLEMLLALAPVLGASGRADQVRHLALARERLSGAEAEAKAERDRYERVARYAGLLSGATLVFIFL